MADLLDFTVADSVINASLSIPTPTPKNISFLESILTSLNINTHCKSNQIYIPSQPTYTPNADTSPATSAATIHVPWLDASWAAPMHVLLYSVAVSRSGGKVTMDRWASNSAARANEATGNKFVPCSRMTEVAASRQSRKMAVTQKRSSGLRCFVARNMTRMVMAMKKTT